MTEPGQFALFRDDQQVSKAHSTRGAAMMEAFEQKAVVTWSRDFWSDTEADAVLANGFEIRTVDA